MGDELKPCPVCHKDGATDRYIRDGRQIFCPHCGWSAPSTFHGPNFEQRLADSWNTRTETQSQATIDELVRALREASKVFREYAASHSRKAGDADGVDEWMDRQRKAARNTDYADKIDTTLANIEKES